MPTGAFAEKYALIPAVRVQQTFDDNLRLAEDNADDTFGTGVAGQLRLRRRTETLELAGVAFLEEVFYQGGNGLPDESNQKASLLTDYRGERTRYRLRLLYQRDSSLSDIRELDESDDLIGAPIDDNTDAGLVPVRIRRNRVRFFPRIEHDLTPRTKLSAAYRYDEVRYSRNENATLNDFKQHRAFAGWRYGLTERDRLDIRGALERFDSSDSDEQTDTVALIFGYEREFSPLTRGLFELGPRYTDVDSPTDDGSNTGALARIGLTRELATSRLSVDFQNTLAPTGAGNKKTTELRLRYRRELLPQRLAFHLRTRGFRDESLDDDDAGDRKYFEIEPKISWNLTRTAALEAGYRYRWVDREGRSSVDNHGVAISLRYEPLAE